MRVEEIQLEVYSSGPFSCPPCPLAASWPAGTMITAVGHSRINAGGYLQPETSPCPGATRASGLHVIRCNPPLPHWCAAAGGLGSSGCHLAHRGYGAGWKRTQASGVGDMAGVEERLVISIPGFKGEKGSFGWQHRCLSHH